MNKAFFFSDSKVELGTVYKNRSRSNLNDSKCVIENLFEEERLKSHKTLPSRLDAIFVCSTIEMSLEWFRDIKVNEIRNGNIDSCYIYEVEINGCVTWFNAKYYNDTGRPRQIVRKSNDELAKLYWESACSVPINSDEEEGLVTGSITFIKEHIFTKDIYGEFVEDNSIEVSLK